MSTWIETIKPLLAKDVDVSNISSILISVFNSIITPAISINQRGKVILPEKFTVQIGTSKRLIQEILQPVVFASIPPHFQESFLDTLFLILRRDVYDVIRFQCLDELFSNYQLHGLNRFLLDLLESKQCRPALSIAKRIIHLLGIVGSAGISATDLKRYLSLLKSPTEWTISLLQSLKIMIKQDGGIVKAAPHSFFNFGGSGAGLHTIPSSFPFSREYQFSIWFRIETFEDDGSLGGHTSSKSIDSKAFNREDTKTQHIVSWSNGSQQGLDIFIERKILVVAVGNAGISRLADHPLRKGVWYHLNVRHSKPRLALFSNDELIVTLDQKVVLQDNVRFPAMGNSPDNLFSFGRNCDGQMGPIYFFGEGLAPAAMECVARADAGKPVDGVDNGFNPVTVDLMPSITTSDRKQTPILSRVVMALHPMRCMNGYALDIHGGRHAKMSRLTQPWCIYPVRNLFNNLGGASCILPLFPHLLVENNSATGDSSAAAPSSTGNTSPLPCVSGNFVSLGTSIADLDQTDNGTSILDYSIISMIRDEKSDLLSDTCIALLLSILAKTIVAHKTYQLELANIRGVEMIEYALTYIPQEILQMESEACVLALIQLKSAASDLKHLELKITKYLLCNFAIWSRASYMFLSSLMSVILSAMNANPNMFLNLLGVNTILDSLHYFMPYYDPIGAVTSAAKMGTRSQGNSSTSSRAGSQRTSRTNSEDGSSAIKVAKPSSLKQAKLDTEIPEAVQVALAALSTTVVSSSSTKSRKSQKARVSLSELESEGTPGKKNQKYRRLQSFKLAVSEQLKDAENEEDEHSDDALETGDGLDSSLVKEVNEEENNGSESGSDNLDDYELALAVDEEQKKHLRECLLAMLAVIVQCGRTEHEISPILDFIAVCRNKIVVNELALVLLLMLVEGGPRIIQSVIISAHGPEEFAAFVMMYMVQQPYEELRCTGIRILTHFYLRADMVPASVLALTLKTRKGSTLSRAMLKFSQQLSGRQGGLQRLQLCGGLAMLCEILTAYAASSSDATYSALLELLLSKPGSKTQVTVQYNNDMNSKSTESAAERERSFSHQDKLATSSQSAYLLAAAAAGLATAGATAGTGNSAPGGRVPQKAVVFAAHYISPDMVDDEEASVMNGYILPLFFELLPKLPMEGHEQIYTDFLALLKHSAGNRDAFCSCPSWHICMYAMVSQLVPNRLTSTKEINKNAASSSSSSPLSVSLRTGGIKERSTTQASPLSEVSHSGVGGSETCAPSAAIVPGSTMSLIAASVHSSIDTGRLASQLERYSGSSGVLTESLTTGSEPQLQNLPAAPAIAANAAGSDGNTKKQALDETEKFDMWFAIGMKIYATLLLHGMDVKGGWKETEKCLALARGSASGSSVVQAILSHVLNELTFNMKSKYRELKFLAKSSSTQDNQDATDRLENILSVMLMAAQLPLLEMKCATYGIKEKLVNRLRVHCLRKASDDFLKKKMELSARGNMDDMARNINQQELRLLLHQTEKLVEEELIKRGSGIDVPPPPPPDDAVVVVATTIDSTNKTADDSPQACGADGETMDDEPVSPGSPAPVAPPALNPKVLYMDFSHVWYDLNAATDASSSSSLSSSLPTSPLRRGSNAGCNGSSANASPLPSAKSVEELLHTLERTHDSSHGSLILVLQTLRFFDAVFWPNNGGSLRNAEMLRFSKPTDAKAGEGTPAANSSSMSICSAVIRMCLHVMNTLAPTTHLAVLNLKRTSILVHSLDKVSVRNTPTHDWLLAILLHTVLGLQRIALALAPVYAFLGLGNIGLVQSVGPWEDSYDDFDRLEEKEGARFDALGGEKETLDTLQSYFDSPQGRNLIRYIRASLFLLVDAFESHHVKFVSSLEERSFRSLWVLIEHIKADLQTHILNFKSSSTVSDLPPTSSKNTFVKPSSRQSVDTTGDIFDRNLNSSSSVLRAASLAVSAAGAVLRGGSGAGSTTGSTGSGGVTATSASAGGSGTAQYGPASARRPSNAVKFEVSDSGSTSKGRAPSTDRNSDSSSSAGHETVGDSSIGEEENRHGQGSSGIGGDSSNGANKAGAEGGGGAGRASGVKSDTSEKDNSFFNATAGTDLLEDCFFGLDILLVLKWLRYPFFKINSCRSIGVLNALEALEQFESKNAVNFSRDSLNLKVNIMEQSDLVGKSLEEMTELKELAMAVNSMLTTRREQHVSATKFLDQAKVKRIAVRWSQSLDLFESDWSPWSGISAPAGQLDESDNNSSSRAATGAVSDTDGPPLTWYEISRTTDMYQRRMMLRKLDEPIDHNDAAYLEGKLKAQRDFLAGTSDVAGALQVKPPKVAQQPFKNTAANWGDDEDDNEDAETDTSSTQNSTAGTVISPMKGGASGVVASALMNQLGFQQAAGMERRPRWSYSFNWQPDERMVYIADTDTVQIYLEQIISGSLLMTNKSIYFHPRKCIGGILNDGDLDNARRVGDTHCYLDRLTRVYGRRHLQKNCAVELMFSDDVELIVGFKNLPALKKFIKVLKWQHLPQMSTQLTSLNPKHVFASNPYTELWRKRQISNFEYLMHLNLMSGRSRNNITQYPVFPWILADYTSKTLDLTNPATFRRLDLPMGALNPERLLEFEDRYKTYDDDTVPPFMYGSHYSSAGVVIHYMIRQEPFTTLAINLQGGRFDCPDRIFFDISRTWQGVNESMSDVKELIPEMFYFPEAFLNSNKVPLGELQEGGAVNDVILPPWAKDSAYEFIRKHREALESDYVSDHLSEWIDLVFGYKQTGPEALAAKNVFYYLSYENAIDIDAIEDPIQKDAAKAHVMHFGQTPSQLLRREHPKRLPKEECLLPLFNDTKTYGSIRIYTPAKQAGATGVNGPVIGVKCSGERLVVCHTDLTLCHYKWNGFFDSEGLPFSLRQDRLGSRALPSAALCAAEESLVRGYNFQKPPSSEASSAKSGESNIGGNDTYPSVTTPAGSITTPQRTDGEEFKFTRTPSGKLNNGTPASKSNMLGSFRSSLRGLAVMVGAAASEPTGNANAGGQVTDSDRENFLAAMSGRRSNAADGSLSAQVTTSTAAVSSFRTMTHLNVALSAADLVGVDISSAGSNASGGRLLSCGYWDHSIKLHALDSLKEVSSSSGVGHSGQVTCIQQGHQGGTYAVSGGVDGTCRVWVVEKPATVVSLSQDDYRGDADVYANQASGLAMSTTASGAGNAAFANGASGSTGSVAQPSATPSANTATSASSAAAQAAAAAAQPQHASLKSNMVCVHTLRGHTSPVRCLNYAYDMDLVVSGSENGILCMHSVRSGELVRRITFMRGVSIDQVLISSAGYILAHSWSDLSVHIYWINGQHLLTYKVDSRIECWVCSANGNVVVCGSREGELTIREAWSMKELMTMDIHSHGGITCLWFTEDYQFLMIGSEDGTFSVATDPEARWKMMTVNMLKTPLLSTGAAL